MALGHQQRNPAISWVVAHQCSPLVISPNVIDSGALKLSLFEVKPKWDPSWEEEELNAFASCSRASSPIPEGTSSYVSGKTEDADMPHAMGDDDCDKAALKERMRLWQQNYDEKWGSEELTWEEKVVEVLHIVRCREFTEYDPKKREFVLTRFCRFNIAFFDFEKESTAAFGPPLSELKRSAWRSLDASVNVISLNITESDVDFPICVFGTVLARDQLDYKCVYLFKRDRDNPQVITSPNDMLTLTGPYRGLDVTDRMFFEINLKIKCDDTGDRDFSKDVIEHNGISHTEKTMDWQVTSWLSTVEFVYAPVQYAVEATLAVTVLRGPCDFSGKVTAWTAGNRKGKVILYDSEAPGTMTKTGDFGSVQLSRRVVAVSLGEKLVLFFLANTQEDCMPLY
ncbi:hypothetical protein EJB05_36540 [Eragrostis curvula]|uniref:DUF6598 domain-containing protein n=1 Tax=Eragrostis curvula TaxID=38414 RepID=A0A5J9U9L7_9POAL|nr:hypothetical protein EJB05_36540 [Eragrostis curvula]